MANIGRKFLTEHGVPEAELDAIMEGINATIANRLSGYVPRDEVQRKIDEALALRDAEADPTDSEAYRRLAEERDMLRAISGAGFEAVKPKFREQVYGMLRRGDGEESVEEQLKRIRENYEEFFLTPAPAGRAPVFGAPTRGSMPLVDDAIDAFSRAWGFGR